MKKDIKNQRFLESLRESKESQRDKEIEKFRKYNYFIWATRPSSVCREYAFMKSFSDNGVKMFIAIPQNEKVSSFFFDRESYMIMCRKVLNRVLKRWKKHLKDYPKLKKKVIESAKRLSNSIAKSSKEELWDLYKECLKAMYDFNDYIMIPFALNELCEAEILKKFNNFDVIMQANKLTEYQKMEIMLLKESPEKTAKEFGWLNVYSLMEDPYTAEELRNIKKGLKKEKIDKMLDAIKANKKEFSRFLTCVKDEDLRMKCILMHEYVFIKNDRVEAWKKMLFYQIPFFKYLAKMFNDKEITSKTTANLMPREIKQILYRVLPNPNELKKRNKPFIHYYDTDIHIVTDKKKINEIKSIVEKKVKQQDFVEGKTGNPGKAYGRVALVLSLYDLKKVKRGNVLVSSVTDPRYTPYMRKCKAVATDEGGMLSHAVITSRELNVPCIVGTKIGTRIFKDGDYVEVDADKGIVKILKRK